MPIPKTFNGKKVVLDRSRKPLIQKGYGVKGSRVRGSKTLLFKTKKEAMSFSKKVGGKPVLAFRKSTPVLVGKKKLFVHDRTVKF